MHVTCHPSQRANAGRHLRAGCSATWRERPSTAASGSKAATSERAAERVCGVWPARVSASFLPLHAEGNGGCGRARTHGARRDVDGVWSSLGVVGYDEA